MRRTVNEAELIDVAADMRSYCGHLSNHLTDLENNLRSLRESWSGIAFDAFLETVGQWRQWSSEIEISLRQLTANAHTAHENYLENDKVNLEMWAG